MQSTPLERIEQKCDEAKQKIEEMKEPTRRKYGNAGLTFDPPKTYAPVMQWYGKRGSQEV